MIQTAILVISLYTAGGHGFLPTVAVTPFANLATCEAARPMVEDEIRSHWSSVPQFMHDYVGYNPILFSKCLPVELK